MKETRIPGMDKIFEEELNKPADFAFGAKVANVFDDMAERSIPFYSEIQRMIGELAEKYAIANTNLVDLGCSTGRTLLQLDKTVDPQVNFIGIDHSQDMLNKCQDKLMEAGLSRSYSLVQLDITGPIQIERASVVILCFTLQFIRPFLREQLIRQIFDGMVEGGVLILAEKILTEYPVFNRDFIAHYYDFKRRNRYSELEISQKREALENVLIPYKASENKSLLLKAGFAAVEPFFTWYNFAGLIALKGKRDGA